MVEPYNRSLKKYPGKFYEEPLEGSSFCVGRGGCDYVPMWHVPFRNPLMRGA